MKKPGEQAKLYYDAAFEVEEGDVLETSTGRRYLVLEAHRSTGRVDRWYLTTVVMHPDDPDPLDATIHPIYWYSRNR